MIPAATAPTNVRRSITESPRRQIDVWQYYTSQRSFSPVGVLLLPANLDGDADRPELADFSRSIFRNRAEQEMRSIVVNSGREVAIRCVEGRIQVRQHY
jgi:hypothetical protein